MSGSLDRARRRALSRRLPLRALRGFSGVGDAAVFDLGEGRESMDLASNWTHDVFGADSMNQQGISNEGAMTSPGDRFGTRQSDPLLVRQLDRSPMSRRRKSSRTLIIYSSLSTLLHMEKYTHFCWARFIGAARSPVNMGKSLS